MSGLKLKRAFAGKFTVMTAEDEQVFGPDTRAACEAFIGSPAASQPVRASDEPTKDQLRAWDRKVNQDLRAPLTEEEAELRAVLAVRRSEDEVEYLMRQFQPLLLAGIQGGRRERTRFIQPKAAA